MKILFVINNFYNPGNGVAASAQRTVKALKSAGQDVKVISGPNKINPEIQPDFPLKEFIFPIFQPIIVKNGFSYADADPKKLEEAIAWADVVHIHEMFMLQFKAVRIAKKLGKPVVATFHIFPENILYNLGMGRWKLANRLLLKSWRDTGYNYCKFVQCPSERVQDRLRRYHFAPELRFISNGLVPDECIRPESPPEDYLDPSRPLRIIYIGRLSLEKDQLTLLEAMRHSKYSRRIQLLFAGNGPKAKLYKKIAKKLYDEGVLAYEPDFSFYDRDGLRQLAATADIAVHCAKVEVEGLSIMEAIQQGTLPIISEGPYVGTSQFAISRRCLFPAGNPEALAHRIDYWLSHPKERWEMGLKHAENMKKYDISESAKAIIQMYKDSLEGNDNE